MRTAASRLAALCGAGLGALCLAALFDTGAQYYDFQLPQSGAYYVEEIELAFYLWYALWGSLAAIGFTLALVLSGLADKLVRGLQHALRRRPRLLVTVAAAAVCFGALFVRGAVLLDEPIADDESTYVFEAQTLLQGRVVNPLPPSTKLFWNQFMVLNTRGWYGKYPIGHPLLLALGEAVGARAVVVPLLAASIVVLAFAAGSQLFDRRRAALGACLLLLSPQFVLTSATQLSQPSSALCLLLGMWALSRLDASGRSAWAAVAGVAFGFGLLVRPMPGGLFLGVAVLHYAVKTHALGSARSWSTRARQLGAAALGVAVFGAAFVAVNRMQAGAALTSGYETFHQGYGLLENEHGEVANSLGGALVRQNFWLFGWTLSLLFVPFARPAAPVLFWGMIAADYAYRVLVPKTVVSTTGPIYVFEIVPLLALATADGAVRAEAALRRLGSQRPRAWIFAFALAASSTALVAFVPVQVRAAARSSAARARVFRELARQRVGPALVYADKLVEPDRRVSWAYYPPNPSPTYDRDEIVFLRKPKGPGSARVAYAMWRNFFPGRRAFVYVDSLQRGALLREISIEPPSSQTTLLDWLALPAGPMNTGSAAGARSGAEPPHTP